MKIERYVGAVVGVFAAGVAVMGACVAALFVAGVRELLRRSA